MSEDNKEANVSNPIKPVVSWKDSVPNGDLNRIVNIMRYLGIEGDPAEWGCAEDLLLDICWKLSI